MSPYRRFPESMRRLLVLVALATAYAGLGAASAVASSADSIVVLRVGDGASALSSSSSAVFLEVRSASDGSVLQTIPVLTAASGANRPLTLSGTASSEGHLSRSLDRRFVVFAGYDTVPGAASVSSTSPGLVNRVIGRLDALGAIDTSTRLDTPGGNARSAASADGAAFWMASSSSCS